MESTNKTEIIDYLNNLKGQYSSYDGDVSVMIDGKVYVSHVDSLLAAADALELEVLKLKAELYDTSKRRNENEKA